MLANVIAAVKIVVVSKARAAGETLKRLVKPARRSTGPRTSRSRAARSSPSPSWEDCTTTIGGRRRDPRSAVGAPG
jgi:hypothetical protein